MPARQKCYAIGGFWNERCAFVVISTCFRKVFDNALQYADAIRTQLPHVATAKTALSKCQVQILEQYESCLRPDDPTGVTIHATMTGSACHGVLQAIFRDLVSFADA